MIIAGAGGHAKEIAGIISALEPDADIFCYDDVSTQVNDFLFGKFRILRNAEEAGKQIKKDPRFVLGTGSPSSRKALTGKLLLMGGQLNSVISPYSRIGTFNMELEEGLNIMTGVVITEEVHIGRGTLINANASVHHETYIGEFCEISPGCHILGNVFIGDGCAIGSGAVVLPGIKIGSGAVIGAGAVVTKDVANGAKLAGVPAKVIS